MYKVIGKKLPIDDAVYKVSGETKYTGDIKLPNMCYGKLILSEIAFGKVLEVEVKEALKVPGVIHVFTYKDFPEEKYNSALRFKDHGIIKSERVLTDEVKFVGDRIGLVVTENIYAAEEALKLIKVKYEEYEPILDIKSSLESQVAIHENVGNKVGTIPAGEAKEKIEELLESADKIYEDQYSIPMVSQIPMETHTVIADYSCQKLTIYASTQNTFAIRILVSDIYRLPIHKVNVIQPTLGGAFGSKLEAVTELVAAGAAIKLKRPVKITLSRKENMIASRTRNGAYVEIKTGVDKEGNIIASYFKMFTDTGAYVGSAMNVIGAMSHKLFKVYKFPLRYEGSPVLTNTPIAGAMRGYGSPQAFLAMHIHLNRIAKDFKVDPIEFLKKIVYKKEEVDKLSFGNPEIIESIDRGMELFKWQERKEKIEKQDRKGDTLRGIGIGIGAHGSGVFPAHQDMINLILRLNEDGSFNYWSASHDMGNGSLMAQKMIMSEVIGIEPPLIEATEVSTETCPWNLGDYASRGVFVEGEGAYKLAILMKDKILEVAALKFGVGKEELSIDKGLIYYKEEAISSLSDVALYAQNKLQEEILVTNNHHSTWGRTSYGAHFAEVEVSRTTGEVRVVDYVGVHDVGQVINRLGIEGQLEGGIQMGIGYALSEKMTFDEKGRLIENNLKKYKVFKANQMPNIIVDFIENGDTGGPFGAKSISECAVVPVAPAVINAVADAIGTTPENIPIDPLEILNLIKE